MKKKIIMKNIKINIIIIQIINKIYIIKDIIIIIIMEEIIIIIIIIIIIKGIFNQEIIQIVIVIIIIEEINNFIKINKKEILLRLII